MFEPVKGGSVEVIQGLECHLPQVGYIYNPIKRKQECIGVYQRAPVSKRQYWQRDKRWDHYLEWKREEDSRKKNDRRYEHPELKEFIEDCWRYRLGGFWFKIQGKPVYITGKHWFYLSCYHLDIGLPDYREVDRQLFYAWEYVEKDPKCYGLCFVTMRRAGKCFGINTPIRMYDGTIKLVQDIEEGEQVMGDDSTPRNVYGVTSGREQMYRIIPNKGMPFECNESHILSLFWNSTGNNPRYGWKAKSYVTITIGDYLKLSHTEKTHLVLHRKGWGDYEERQHIIPPYLLGLYLGDGCSKTGGIATADKEIILKPILQRERITPKTSRRLRLFFN